MPSTTPNLNWFEIRYTESAPAGLPPMLQAEHVVRYADDAGTWVAALWSHADTNATGVLSCVLRIREAHVAEISKRDDITGTASATTTDGRCSDREGGDTK